MSIKTTGHINIKDLVEIANNMNYMDGVKMMIVETLFRLNNKTKILKSWNGDIIIIIMYIFLPNSILLASHLPRHFAFVLIEYLTSFFDVDE
jgi:hypothetical protein